MNSASLSKVSPSHSGNRPENVKNRQNRDAFQHHKIHKDWKGLFQDNQDKSSFHGSIGHSVSRFLPNSPQKIPHAFL